MKPTIVQDAFEEFIACGASAAEVSLTPTNEWIERDAKLDSVIKALCAALNGDPDNLLGELEDVRNCRDALSVKQCYKAGLLAGIGMGAAGTQLFLSIAS